MFPLKKARKGIVFIRQQTTKARESVRGEREEMICVAKLRLPLLPINNMASLLAVTRHGLSMAKPLEPCTSANDNDDVI